MKFYAVIYDLRQPGRKYNELYDAIKNVAGIGNWQHPMESFWLLSVSELSHLNANILFDTFRKHIDENDSIMVCKMDLIDSQGWMPKSLWSWVNEQRNKQ